MEALVGIVCLIGFTILLGVLIDCIDPILDDLHQQEKFDADLRAYARKRNEARQQAKVLAETNRRVAQLANEPICLPRSSYSRVKEPKEAMGSTWNAAHNKENVDASSVTQ